MLKEQALLTDDEEAEIGLCIRRECHREGVNEYDTKEQTTRAIREAQLAKALNLIKAEVEGLTVIKDGYMEYIDKKQLLDLMEE